MYEKIIIYQTLPRLSGNRVEHPVPGSSFDINGTGKFADYTFENLEYVKNLGCTHIWFTGVLEHATQSKCLDNLCTPDSPEIVKGIAGSPYAIKDYYDVSHYLAVDHNRRLEEYEELIERCHKTGLKVIMDFVPNHVSRGYKSDKNPGKFCDFGDEDDRNVTFSPDNDYYYLPGKRFRSPLSPEQEEFFEYPAKVTGNDCFNENPSLNDWYEAVKLNYGVDFQSGKINHFNPRPKIWDKMVDIIIYWCDKGVDGFRCDMAEMVPKEFWSYLTNKVRSIFPDLLFIAEVYNPDLYKDYLNSGFNFLYDKVGLYDTLVNIIRGYSSPSDISKCWQSLGDIQDNMLNFMENHDEQRLASDFIAKLPERGIPAVAVSLLLNRAPFMLYFAQELGERGMDKEGFSGEDGKTTIFDFWSLSSIINYSKGIYNVQLNNKYRLLLNIANKESAIREGQTYDLQYANKNNSKYDFTSIFSFARYYNNEIVFIVVNFSDFEKEIELNIPQHLFVHWGINQDIKCNCVDLFSGTYSEMSLSPKIPVRFRISENDVKILKLLLQ